MPKDISGKEIGLVAIAAAAIGGASYLFAKGIDSQKPGETVITQGILDAKKMNIDVFKVAVQLTPAQRAILDAKWKNAGQLIPKPAIPTFREVSGKSFEPKGVDGLLGKLVAASWAFAHTRQWYMTRCKQYHPFDDTTQWLAKDAPHGGHNISKSAYNAAMEKDTGFWPIGVPRAFILNRFDGENPSKFNTYQRLNSLDLTFPNWSMPFGGYSDVFAQGGYLHGYYGDSSFKKRCWRQCGFRRTANWGSLTNSECNAHDCPDVKPTRWWYKSRFKIQPTPFAVGTTFDGNDIASRVIMARNYKYRDHNWEDDKAFAGVVEKYFNHISFDLPIVGLANLPVPGRIWGRVSTDERRAARYKIKVPSNYAKQRKIKLTGSEELNSNIEQSFSNDIYDYYEKGYALVNTVLDILIDRGLQDIDKEFPAFARHCNWWWILPPNKDMLAYVRDKDNDLIRMARLSDIGASAAGLNNISLKTIVNYVMSITPPPGTIPPWEDKGPLWGWPKEAGQMIPAGPPKQPQVTQSLLRSGKTDIWSSWNNFLEYALATVNQTVYDFVMKEAGTAVEGLATKTIASWAEKISSDLLDKLQDNLGGAFSGVMDIASKVATFAGMIENIDLADYISPSIKKSFEGTVLNSYDLIKEYLVQVADDKLPKSQLDYLKDKTELAMKPLREWGYADDLIGELASVTSSYNSIKNIKSPNGFYKTVF